MANFQSLPAAGPLQAEFDSTLASRERALKPGCTHLRLTLVGVLIEPQISWQRHH
jgi:hypothetical protein